MICEEGEMHNDWLKLCIEWTRNGYSTKDFICPECGSKGVECIYVGNPTTRIGYLPIWCTHCKKGTRISRVIIPQGVDMMDFDDLESICNRIPNYKCVE